MVSPREMVSSSQVALANVADPRDGRWSVPDGWQQGRGAWGGLVIAALVRSAEAAEAQAGSPGRAVRSVSAQIVAPVLVGDTVVTTREVRRGSSTSTWSVEILADDVPAVSASVVFGDPRRGDPIVHGAPTPPSAPEWSQIASIELGPPLAPDFLQHLTMRPVSGLPYSGSDEDILVWLGYPQGRFDAASLLGLVDGPWPVPLVRITQPRPMATLSFMANLLLDPEEVDSTQPLLFSSQMLGEHDGYVTERRHLWTPDGRLAVENLQLITIIK